MFRGALTQRSIGKCEWSRFAHEKSFRGFLAILFKEFIVVLRDPMTLFFMFFPPLIEMIAFGYALDNDVKHMATAIYNEDRTAESRAAH